MTRLVAFLTAILLVSGSVMPQQLQDFIDCLSVIIYFSSCVEYIDGHVSEPARSCCMGVQELNRLAKQDDNVRRICQCIELIAAVDGPSFIPANINALPNKCQTHLSFPISVNKNCSK